MKIKDIFIYFICAIIIFQDTINKIIPISLIGYIDEVLVIVLSICALNSIIVKKRINRTSLKIIYFLIIFSFVGIYSCYINSEFILKDVLMSNFLAIKFFIVIISILNIDIKYSTINTIKKSVLFYSKLVMIFAIPNFIFPNIYKNIFTFITLTYRAGLPSVCSLFVHTGTYGWFMLFIASYHYSSYIQNKDKKELKHFIITSFFAIVSFRVKVIMALIVILIYGTIIININKINLKKFSILTISLFTIIIAAKDILINTYLMYFTNQFGESARQALTVNSINIAKDYFPIGVGFGKFASWYARINYSEHYYEYGMTYVFGLSPDNPFFATDTYWPSIIGEAGVIGTIVFIIIIISIYRKLRTMYNHSCTRQGKILITWAIFAMIQMLVESTSEAIFNNSPQFILISFLIGICMCKNIINFKEG